MSREETIFQALDKAKKMANCLGTVLEFIESKGLEEELLVHLQKVRDPYYMLYLSKKGFFQFNKTEKLEGK